MRVENEQDAVDVLLAHQREQGGTETQPARDLTEETRTGWAFYNTNGYLGSVTYDGEVVIEEEQVTDE
jgi:hypothetical protein